MPARSEQRPRLEPLLDSHDDAKLSARVNGESWQTLLERASALRLAGRPIEAIDAYERLLAAQPDLPESWYNLALLQRQARRFEEALESYEQALLRGVSGPEEVHLNRAVILSDHLRRPGDAEAELHKALSINPGYVPAMLNLGNLDEDMGRLEEAKSAYRRALTAEPGNVLALARLAGLGEAAGTDDPLIARLRQAIDRHDISASDRADLGFALGRLLDGAGAYEQAFETYHAANAASRASSGPQFRGYDRRGHEAFVDRLIATFSEPAKSSRSRQGGSSSPLFICGMFRSGSTLAEQILSGHSGVSAGGELDLIPAIVQQYLQPYPESVAALDSAAVERLRKTYMAGLDRMNLRGRLVTDKRPDNFLHIGLIKKLFPESKIIYTRRNPLDNVLSLYFLHLNPRMAYALDLEDAAHWYAQHRRLMHHWKSLYANDVFELDYDELVENPRPAIRALLEFCNLDWEEACLDFHKAAAPVKTASVWQVRQPLYSKASGRWRNYAEMIEPVRKALEGPDQAFGLEP